MPLERDLALAVAPPRPGALAGVIERRDVQRAVLTHLVEHGRDVARLAHLEFTDALATAALLHAVAKERVAAGRDERGGVAPVLEELTAAVRHLIEQFHAVGAEPREERHVVRAHQHVDGVDLQHPGAVEHASQVAHVDATRRARLGEALRGERDATSLCEREISRRHGPRRYIAAAPLASLRRHRR